VIRFYRADLRIGLKGPVGGPGSRAGLGRQVIPTSTVLIVRFTKFNDLEQSEKAAKTKIPDVFSRNLYENNHITAFLCLMALLPKA